MRFLFEQDATYHSKALELKESISDWLTYIPATFPHYTRHTIAHSEEIIKQLSKVLFINGDSGKPVLQQLSAIEAYILVAAYLHDAGMTVSDKEKRSILESPEWKLWVGESGGGAVRFQEIKSLREGNKPSDETVRSFLADVQTRFLIAEFVRKTHHIRGGEILALHQDSFGRFAYGDPILTQTIATVCVAHGLQQHELNDNIRFPERRDIRNETVNVRLLAILLRIGDLLDMSYDRACPLLLNAASPIPADSYAHWTQYQRITHISVEYDRIELQAQCYNDDEHRFLHDWCDWLVSELDKARGIMARSTRHTGWQPPKAIIDQLSGNTIEINPAPGALYIPAKWRFELDNKAVFERLIHDALDEPTDFLRELIQNAADASRCRLFNDLQYGDEQDSVPVYPTQVSENWRNKYPIIITLETIEIKNNLSEELENRQILTVEDAGIGMDRDVIQKYLLQVGRSFYTTREFRDKFGFVASSRFGVGFLSVFSVSNDVTIETYKPTSVLSPEPLKIRLTGPRSYLLMEKGDRRVSGTRIRAILDEDIEQGELTRLINFWCKKLEFPVVINDLGITTTVKAEQSNDYITESDDIEGKGKYIIRTFSFNKNGVEGDMYIFAHLINGEEYWVGRDEISSRSQDIPYIDVPALPDSAVFFHGINMKIGDYEDDNLFFSQDNIGGFRIDLRGERFQPSLARNNVRSYESILYKDLDDQWDVLLRKHLDENISMQGKAGWRYKQFLSDNLGSYDFWRKESDTFPIIINGRTTCVDYNFISELKELNVVFNKSSIFHNRGINKKVKLKTVPKKGVFIDGADLYHIRPIFSDCAFLDRELVDIEKQGDLFICKWSKNKLKNSSEKNWFFMRLNSSVFGGALHPVTSERQYCYFINTNHQLGEWYERVSKEIFSENSIISLKNFTRLESMIKRTFQGGFISINELEHFLSAWKKIADLPEYLLPPGIAINHEEFDIENF